MLFHPGEPEAFISSIRSLMGSQDRKIIKGTKRFHKKEKSSKFGSMELPLSSQGYKVNKALFGVIFFGSIVFSSSVHFSLAVSFEF